MDVLQEALLIGKSRIQQPEVGATVHIGGGWGERPPCKGLFYSMHTLTPVNIEACNELCNESLSLRLVVKDTLMTAAKRSSAVAGIFWQADRMSWIVV